MIIAGLVLATAASAAILSPDERAPLVVIVTAPTGNTGVISSSELIAAIGEVLERRTDLAARVAAPELVEECGGSVGCLAIRARDEVKDAKLLFVLSVLPATGADSAAALLIDLQTEKELAPLARRRLAEKKEAARFLDELCTTTFKPALEARGHYEPYAELELANELDRATLRIDGEPRGTLPAGTSTLRLKSGTRAVSVEADGYTPWSATLILARGTQTRAAAHLSAWTKERSAPMRTGLLWAGAGLVVTGAAVAIFAAAKNDPGVDTLCLYGAGGDRAMSCGEGSRFITPGYDPEAAIEGRARLNPGGIMLAPLGWAIASAGATWSLSMLLRDDDSGAPPWIELLAGAALGAAVYGVAALSNGDEPR